MRALGIAAVLLAAVVGVAGREPAPRADPAPASIEEFSAAVRRVVQDAALPGAAIALVRPDRLEWAGGVGWADRDARRPVDADTHFRVGSVTTTFTALALVQLYEDGDLDLEATVASLLPDVRIDNPWQRTDPVRVRHLLEHTAGFDDRRFTDAYALDGASDLPLDEVLQRNPSSRRVRWRPGTRMAFSSPGYAVAGRIVEVVSGTPFEQFVRDRILTPSGMPASAFPVRPDDDPALARGYDARTGPPVTNRPIYLRPAGALQTSARELGHFVQMLLNWGERDGEYVVDPEYLSNMEWPRTTAAAAAGVRAGYGLGIHSLLDGPYHVLGHTGGLDGFSAAFGYSPSRDAGYVVLLNGTYAPAALTRLTTLAMSYLKRDVEPASDAPFLLPEAALRRFEGYYQDANPRHALMRAIDVPLGGRTVRVENGHLTLSKVFGPSERLVPVNDAIFRRAHERAASMVFTTVDGGEVLAGHGIYAEKRARWPYDVLRFGLVAAFATGLAAPLAALIRGAVGWRRDWVPARSLGLAWTVVLAVFGGGLLLAATTTLPELASPSVRAWTIYASSILYPMLAFALLPLTVLAWTSGVGTAFAWFSAAVAAAHLALAAYASWWGLVAFRSWTY